MAESRTRRVILDAAVSVLSKDADASLGYIAIQAGVGRTTVHRHFPERSDLIAALGADALAKITEATARARLDDGPAWDALERLCREYFEFGDLFTLVLAEPRLAGPEWAEESEPDREFHRLIERGQAEGAIDGRLSPAWVQLVLWSLLSAAWQHVRDGAPRQEALDLCLLTLRKSVAAVP